MEPGGFRLDVQGQLQLVAMGCIISYF